jgi:hypothetical protein
MGYDGKYGTVTTEHGNIPDDEPVLVFRARDMTTDKLLPYYAMLCMKAGSPLRHISMIWSAHMRFREWRKNNEQQVRVPDSERSRAWMGDKLSVKE